MPALLVPTALSDIYFVLDHPFQLWQQIEAFHKQLTEFGVLLFAAQEAELIDKLDIQLRANWKARQVGIRIRQRRQVFQVKMLIARHQLFLANAERIGKKRQEINRHITVVHKTSYRTYFTLLYLFLQLSSSNRFCKY